MMFPPLKTAKTVMFEKTCKESDKCALTSSLPCTKIGYGLPAMQTEPLDKHG